MPNHAARGNFSPSSPAHERAGTERAEPARRRRAAGATILRLTTVSAHPHPFRVALACAVSLASLAVQPCDLRAQGTNYSSVRAIAWPPYAAPEVVNTREVTTGERISASAAAGGGGSTAYVDLVRGKVGAAAFGSNDGTGHGGIGYGEALYHQSFGLTNGRLTSIAQDFEFYFDGVITPTPARDNLSSLAYGQLTVQLWRRFGFETHQVFLTATRVDDTYEDLAPRRVYRFTDHLSGGETATYTLGVRLNAYAAGETSADFSHTMSVFVPLAPTTELYTDTGFLTQQSRPTWAAAPVTTAPEPASLALLAVGTLGVAGVVRVRRRAA